MTSSLERRNATLLQEESGHVTEALLYMRRATPDKFRKYTIVAENSVGISRRDVELVLKGQLMPFFVTRIYTRQLSSVYFPYGITGRISHSRFHWAYMQQLYPFCSGKS